jgi:hypothetical protein
LAAVDTKTILSADGLRIFHELKTLAQEAERKEGAIIEKHRRLDAGTEAGGSEAGAAE